MFRGMLAPIYTGDKGSYILVPRPKGGSRNHGFVVSLCLCGGLGPEPLLFSDMLYCVSLASGLRLNYHQAQKVYTFLPGVTERPSDLV